MNRCDHEIEHAWDKILVDPTHKIRVFTCADCGIRLRTQHRNDCQCPECQHVEHEAARAAEVAT